jgi:Asp/Glu/hydantoin racemase
MTWSIADNPGTAKIRKEATDEIKGVDASVARRALTYGWRKCSLYG